jgi:hypothetical protein
VGAQNRINKPGKVENLRNRTELGTSNEQGSTDATNRRNSQQVSPSGYRKYRNLLAKSIGTEVGLSRNTSPYYSRLDLLQGAELFDSFVSEL